MFLDIQTLAKVHETSKVHETDTFTEFDFQYGSGLKNMSHLTLFAYVACQGAMEEVHRARSTDLFQREY